MKLIKAIIKPFKLEEVISVLIEIGVTGFTVIETRGYLKENVRREGLDQFSEEINLNPQIMIEMAVTPKLVTIVINRLLEVAKAGNNEDGRIFVLPLEQAVDIFTEDYGDNIL